jgi:hypothetical protein
MVSKRNGTPLGNGHVVHKSFYLLKEQKLTFRSGAKSIKTNFSYTNESDNKALVHIRFLNLRYGCDRIYTKVPLMFFQPPWFKVIKILIVVDTSNEEKLSIIDLNTKTTLGSFKG